MAGRLAAEGVDITKKHSGPQSFGLPLAALTRCSLREHLVQTIWIEANHDFFAHDDGGSGATLIGPDQFEYSLLVHADVLDFKWDPFLRKVGLGP
jgi:hypothetical protein